MKIVIMGGTGLIGRKLVATLKSGGHAVVAASPTTGVNSLTGEGLKEALTGAKYFGAVLDKDGLAPTGKFIRGPTRFADWARAYSSRHSRPLR